MRGGRSWALLLAALSSCALDFDVRDRDFDCPPTVAPGCIACDANGTCKTYEDTLPVVRDPQQPPMMPEPGPPRPTLPDEPLPDGKVPPVPDGPPVIVTPVDGGTGDPPPDGGTTPTLPEVCPEYAARASDSLCVDDEHCFSLGSVLSPALAAWLDPTSLPRDGSRYWCDRSGQQHHALLEPETAAVAIEPDGRAVSEALARSFLLNGGSLWLSEGTQPPLGSGNFAVLVAAAALPTPDLQAFELFESGALEKSRLTLTVAASTGKAEGRIESTQTGLPQGPVVTRSSVYDGAFHLFSLYRRSEVRVLDDVLNLRLNGVLEFRSSAAAILRALDFSAPSPPRVGGRAASGGSIATGQGRVAAVVILRGSVPEEELLRVETFLCTALAVCTAPAPAPPAAPASPPAP